MLFVQHGSRSGHFCGQGTDPAHPVFFDRSRRHGMDGLENSEGYIAIAVRIGSKSKFNC
jgi:hypothetical protein